MLLLRRRISRYDAVDLVLGVFRRRSEAERAADEYRAHLERAGDPWSTQTYRQNGGSLDVDVVEGLAEVGVDDSCPEVLVVSAIQGAMGQTFRESIATFGNVDDAFSRADELERGWKNSDERWAVVEVVDVGRLITHHDTSGYARRFRERLGTLAGFVDATRARVECVHVDDSGISITELVVDCGRWLETLGVEGARVKVAFDEAGTVVHVRALRPA